YCNLLHRLPPVGLKDNPPASGRRLSFIGNRNLEMPRATRAMIKHDVSSNLIQMRRHQQCSSFATGGKVGSLLFASPSINSKAKNACRGKADLFRTIFVEIFRKGTKGTITQLACEQETVERKLRRS